MKIELLLDIQWIVLAAGMVFLMQAGFAALESGLTRARNSTNVALKNIADFTMCLLCYCIVGYGLMFGTSVGGWWGGDNFGMSLIETPHEYAVFLFQALFAATAATIVSGAVAERVRFKAYIVVAIVISAFIYPVSGHWVWAENGWLAEMGMVDFAGSSVVHLVGGAIGLAGAWVLGPRLGRFDADGNPVEIQGSNQVMAVIGVLILWFGWFGFNAGSTFALEASIAKIMVNTALSASAGGAICLFLATMMSGQAIHVGKILNGVIGGLVGVTAGCAILEPAGAIAIGATSGLVAYGAEWVLIRKLRIDDPVHVIPTHMACGFWGTVMLVFFAPTDTLPLNAVWAQFQIQLLGATVIFLWAFGTGYLLFKALQAAHFLRVPPEAEKMGLNAYEHGLNLGISEIKAAMKEVLPVSEGGNGNLTARLPVDVGTDEGDVASEFNTLIRSYHNTVVNFQRGLGKILEIAYKLSGMSHDIRTGAKDQLGSAAEVNIAIQKMLETIEQMSDISSQAKEQAVQANSESNTSTQVAGECYRFVQALAHDIGNAGKAIEELKERSEEINNVTDGIHNISNQTNLLALNASIEAARAGESGRGFGVVASEIRNLATQSAEFAGDIRHVVENIQQRSGEASATMTASIDKTQINVEQVQQLEDSFKNINHTLDTIKNFTINIKNTIQDNKQATESVESILKNIMSIAETARANADAATIDSNGMTQLAGQLDAMINKFQVDDTQVPNEDNNQAADEENTVVLF